MASKFSSMHGLSATQLEEYREQGFLVLREFLSAGDVANLQQETEELLVKRKDLIDPNNLRCRFMPHYETGEPLFEVFDPINEISPVCERITRLPELLAVLESLYGEPACLFKEKLIYKPPGAKGYDLHQDIPQCWSGFPQSFLTVLIAVDSSNQQNGCTSVYRGYHSRFLSDDPAAYMLPLEMVDESRRVDLELQPGDLAIFHGLTPHRSEPNRSNQMRRTFYVSYNALSEGGDQRAHHYRQFHEKLRQYRQSATPGAQLEFR